MNSERNRLPLTDWFGLIACHRPSPVHLNNAFSLFLSLVRVIVCSSHIHTQCERILLTLAGSIRRQRKREKKIGRKCGAVGVGCQLDEKGRRRVVMMMVLVVVVVKVDYWTHTH